MSNPNATIMAVAALACPTPTVSAPTLPYSKVEGYRFGEDGAVYPSERAAINAALATLMGGNNAIAWQVAAQAPALIPLLTRLTEIGIPMHIPTPKEG
jgi:hypothetical protein